MACTGEKQAAVNFANVFCTLLDKHRAKLGLYLADDAVLDWFGRTVYGKENICGFMSLEVPETVHSFTSVEPSGPITHRKKTSSAEHMDDDSSYEISSQGKQEHGDSFSDDDLAKPLGYPENSYIKEDDILSKLDLENLSFDDTKTDDSKAKAAEPWESRLSTPVNSEVQYKNAQCEQGQGDCFPKVNIATFTKANKFLEARGSIQFQRTKQSNMKPKNMKLLSDTMKWGRFCKLQVAYSVSETGFANNSHGNGLENDFKIWLLIYQDNTRCRRNLSEAFEQIK